ncbi:MAG: hypothetical protein KGS10_16160 [Chloroflexi bacterium]|nr:hypothetical protein [Chloroflexota bacterium]
MSVPDTRPTTTAAPAWAWILAHHAIIRSYSFAFARSAKLDHEDFRQELIADLAMTFAKYDPARGAAKGWVWMRASAVRRSMVRSRQMIRARTEAHRNPKMPAFDATEPVPEGQWGHADHTEALIDLARMRNRADEGQRTAMRELLEAAGPVRGGATYRRQLQALL